MSIVQRRLVFLTIGMLLGGLGAWFYWPHFAGLGAKQVLAQKRPPREPNLDAFANFLESVVCEGGVDYALARKHQADLDTFLADLAFCSPGQWSPSKRLAMLVNAYNAFVIKGVLDQDIQQGIAEAGANHKFFREKRYNLAGIAVSLNGLELELIRPLNPNCHFMLNCASKSCPQLRQQPFREKLLSQQIDLARTQFLSDKQKNFCDPQSGIWHLSSLFNWYEKDFGGRKDMVAMIRAVTGWPEPTQIQYLPYDWSLNNCP
ncbi:MAG: DUF547 domain-containing protein [Acidobacteria bacterium]|nr:DUF547 domain-containing protein [Acidobacteriota bacterium]